MKSPAETFERARRLRWTMTEPERMLWAMLRRNQLALRFRRQHPMGVYVLDFYCPSARLCVEVDGPAHQEIGQAERDAKRDAWLEDHGVRVIRFSAVVVSERPAAVVASIAQAATPSVASGDTSPAALPQGRT
jgi:very-short-patch-repair endonuclease